MLLDGQRLGNFELIRLLDRGGMGEVYVAKDLNLPREVAIKVVREEANLDTAMLRERFNREMAAVAMLEHDHILPIHMVGDSLISGAPIRYMVMPYKRLGSLDDWLQQRRQENKGPLAPADVVALIGQAADALQYAHDRHIIHRDIKPKNFLLDNLTNPNQPKLLLADFGLVKVLEDGRTSTHNLGTVYYMAPEQWSKHPTTASDQYSLAVMTYELLTNELPFQGSQIQVMYQHISVQPEPPSAHTSAIPKEMDAVVLRAMRKAPEERYPSIKAYADALQEALGKRPSPPQPDKPDKPEPKPGDKREKANSGPTGASSTLPPLVRPRGDNYATLTLTPQEAASGSMKQLTVMDGLEQKTVRLRVLHSLNNGEQLRFVVPQQLDNGHTLHLQEQYAGSEPITRSLVVTVNVLPEKKKGNRAAVIITLIILVLVIAFLVALGTHIIAL